MRCVPLRAGSSFIGRKFIRTVNGRFVLTGGCESSNSVFICSQAKGTVHGVGHGKRKKRRCVSYEDIALSRRGGRVFVGSFLTEGVGICSLRKGFGQDVGRGRSNSARFCLSVFGCSGRGLVYCSRYGRRVPFLLMSGRSKGVAGRVEAPFGRGGLFLRLLERRKKAETTKPNRCDEVVPFGNG